MDIDILRAVAVLAVIFFHFDVPYFEGGFLGVDIFFVISGYLITLHIQEQLEGQSFNFLNFYLRRIRRLFPALIATMLLCSFFALLILPKALLDDFSKSQIASATYVSNIYFWLIADYFDTANILKPLLHTWSLSVEEQFYAIWPLFLLLTFRTKRKLAIFAALIVSLVAAELMYDYSPSATFYLFPFRVFEFAIGAMVCGVSLQALPRPLRSSLLLIGGACVTYSLFMVDEHSRNPGLITLPLCLGTALIIALRHPWANKTNLFFSGILRIGLISYSAYLVHWPLVVFYKFYRPGDLQIAEALALLLLTYVLAELLYQFVEVPTSKIDLYRRRAAVLATVPGMFIMALAIDVGNPKLYELLSPREPSVKAILDRIPDRQSIIEQAERELAEAERYVPGPNHKTILVIGDSHAIDVSLSLRLLLQNANYRVELLHSICDPLDLGSIEISIADLYANNNQERTRNPEYCEPFHAAFLETIRAYSPDLVIFSEAWRTTALPFFSNTVSRVKAVIPTNILILGRNPQLEGPPNVIFSNFKDVTEINRRGWDMMVKWYDEYDQKLLKVAQQTQSFFISKNELICPHKQCNILIGGEMGFSDIFHWTRAGMEHYGNLLISHPNFIMATNIESAATLANPTGYRKLVGRKVSGLSASETVYKTNLSLFPEHGIKGDSKLNRIPRYLQGWLNTSSKLAGVGLMVDGEIVEVSGIFTDNNGYASFILLQAQNFSAMKTGTVSFLAIAEEPSEQFSFSLLNRTFNLRDGAVFNGHDKPLRLDQKRLGGAFDQISIRDTGEVSIRGWMADRASWTPPVAFIVSSGSEQHLHWPTVSRPELATLSEEMTTAGFSLAFHLTGKEGDKNQFRVFVIFDDEAFAEMEVRRGLQ